MSATAKIWVNGVPPTCEDADLNGFKLENNNLIVGSGQGLNTGDNQQTHKAVAHYAAVGDYYVDSGTAAAYVLSITGVQVAPPTYANGMRIRFIAGNTNSASPTINVAGLGVKNLFDEKTGAAMAANVMLSGKLYEGYYDGTQVQIRAGDVLSGIATMSATTISISAGAFGSVNVSYTLGTDDIDWGFSVLGSGATADRYKFLVVAQSADGHLQAMNTVGATISSFATSVPSGQIRFDIKNAGLAAQTFTFKAWARRR